MKNSLENMDKLLENKVRLGILSILMVNESVSFSELKEALNLSDGNLASHLKSLEQGGYILTVKQFIGRKPNTSVGATVKGRQAFEKHLKALEEFLNSLKE